MDTLNYTKALELLREIVAEEGEDFVYKTGKVSHKGPNCLYAFEGKGDCGVGRVLVKVGVPALELEWSETHEGAYSTGTAEMVFGDLAEDEVLYVTSKAARLLGKFQEYQDTGYAWGQSLDYAIRAAQEIEDL